MKLPPLRGALAILPLVLTLVWGPDVPGQEKGPLLLRAGRVIPVEGEPLEGGAVLVRDGRIAAVAAAPEVPPATEVLAFPEAVIFPGFVDGGCYFGIRRQRDETTSSVLPGVRMAEALNPFDPSVEEARRAGITTFHLIPGDANVVGGRSAVVKIMPDGGVRWLADEAGLKISLVEAAYVQGREPTSAVGAVAKLQEMRREGILPEVGGGRFFAAAMERREVDLASRLSDLCGLRPVLLASVQARHHARSLTRSSTGVILRPLLPELLDADRAAAAELAAAGVGLGLASEGPLRPPEALRLSAVVACLGGLEVRDAHRALTLGCARLLGVEAHVGSLRPGKDADLLVLSHDPTDPRARILLVMQEGRIVHRADSSM